MRLLEEAREKQEFITGLIYINEKRPRCRRWSDLPETPLAHLPESQLRPPREALAKIMDGLK